MGRCFRRHPCRLNRFRARPWPVTWRTSMQWGQRYRPRPLRHPRRMCNSWRRWLRQHRSTICLGRDTVRDLERAREAAVDPEAFPAAGVEVALPPQAGLGVARAREAAVVVAAVVAVGEGLAAGGGEVVAI